MHERVVGREIPIEVKMGIKKFRRFSRVLREGLLGRQKADFPQYRIHQTKPNSTEE
jgi:hypothetical protein